MENKSAPPRSHHHHHHHHHLRPVSHSPAGGGGGGGGREDCWSEGATEILVKAWGDRYLELNRGNLRQKDWKEVADAVNNRENGVKPRKTDAQCKNRVDTLKKKFKVERSKILPSKWPFYSRLDRLVGSAAPQPPTPASKKSAPRNPTVKFTVKPLEKKTRLNPNTNTPVLYSASMDESSGDRDGDDEDMVVDGSGRATKQQRGGEGEAMDSSSSPSDGAAIRELAGAFLKFGEIYERIESLKQRQMMELEKVRLEFTKDLEFQRMRVFMETQLELEKMKPPPKSASASGKKQ